MHEEVIDTRNDSSVCDSATCGQTMYDGSPLPYSEVSIKNTYMVDFRAKDCTDEVLE